MKVLRTVRTRSGRTAKDNAKNLKNYGVNINQTVANAAKKIGGGNISLGIRIAVRKQRSLMAKKGS